MKIGYVSDLHLEVNSLDIKLLKNKYDLLIAAGDIAIGFDAIKWFDKLKIPVIYVPGNHEYEGLDITQMDKHWKIMSSTNVHCLQKDIYIKDNLRILGCTLWTDFNLIPLEYRDLSIAHSNRCMPEYKFTNKGRVLLQAKDTIKIHYDHLDWINKILSIPFSGNTIVVTHHAPHSLSLDTKYKPNLLTNCFASDLNLGRDVIWIHGHTHFSVQYAIEDTIVLSNPRGYPKYANDIGILNLDAIIDTNNLASLKKNIVQYNYDQDTIRYE